jgi:3-hydroxymyristoyl/3-hydroxydecanoyl-(acyl carrier protein) dehydratase
VSMDLVRTAERLRAHAWVGDARCGHAGNEAPGMVLVLNHTGIEALCRLGRQRLTDTLQRDAGYTGAPVTWRLLDALPASTSAQQIDAWLQAPMPQDALLLDEQEHDGVWTLALRVPLDLLYFPGHFPQAPVLPGVVQIAWALAFAATRLGTPSRCHVMEALKFQQLLRPGDRADLTLRHDAARHKLHFAYRHGDKAYSSGRLAWSAAS